MAENKLENFAPQPLQLSLRYYKVQTIQSSNCGIKFIHLS